MDIKLYSEFFSKLPSEKCEEFLKYLTEICSPEDEKGYISDFGIKLCNDMQTKEDIDIAINFFSGMSSKTVKDEILDFVFRFSDFGPDLYEELYGKNISDDKKWEIDLKRHENNILMDRECIGYEECEKELLDGLSKTSATMSLDEIGYFLHAGHIEDINKEIQKVATSHFNVYSRVEGLDKNAFNIAKGIKENAAFKVTKDENGTFFIEGTGPLSHIKKPIDLNRLDLNLIACLSENVFERELKNNESLSNKQKTLLETYKKIAVKLQGFWLEKTRDDDPPSPPTVTAKPLKEYYQNVNLIKELHDNFNQKEIDLNTYNKDDFLTKLNEFKKLMGIDFNKINQDEIDANHSDKYKLDIDTDKIKESEMSEIDDGMDLSF